MLCSRCKKRPAVVFITRMEGEKPVNDGICLTCAKELGIKPVDDLLEKFGITDDDMEQMDQQLSALINPGDGEDGDGDFMPGGAATFPFLRISSEERPQRPTRALPRPTPRLRTKEKKSKEKKRKYLSTYCTDLTRKAREGKLDAIIGRDREIYRVVQILSAGPKIIPA